jgi:hypothetical protein
VDVDVQTDGQEQTKPNNEGEDCKTATPIKVFKKGLHYNVCIEYLHREGENVERGPCFALRFPSASSNSAANAPVVGLGIVVHFVAVQRTMGASVDGNGSLSHVGTSLSDGRTNSHPTPSHPVS